MVTSYCSMVLHSKVGEVAVFLQREGNVLKQQRAVESKGQFFGVDHKNPSITSCSFFLIIMVMILYCKFFLHRVVLVRGNATFYCENNEFRVEKKYGKEGVEYRNNYYLDDARADRRGYLLGFGKDWKI